MQDENSNLTFTTQSKTVSVTNTITIKKEINIGTRIIDV